MTESRTGGNELRERPLTRKQIVKIVRNAVAKHRDYIAGINQIADDLLAALDARSPQDSEDLLRKLGGYRVVADVTVPRDEIHWRSEEGTMLGVMKLAALGDPSGDVPASRVKMPETEDEAAMMALIGVEWLREHAPHRLTKVERARTTLAPTDGGTSA